MGKGYAEGSAVEERLAALERGDDLTRRLDTGRAAVYASTEAEPERHFIGWADEVDPDALFAAGAAWGIQVVRRGSRSCSQSSSSRPTCRCWAGENSNWRRPGAPRPDRRSGSQPRGARGAAPAGGAGGAASAAG